jgi:hypothetical protein
VVTGFIRLPVGEPLANGRLLCSGEIISVHVGSRVPCNRHDPKRPSTSGPPDVGAWVGGTD